MGTFIFIVAVVIILGGIGALLIGEGGAKAGGSAAIVLGIIMALSTMVTTVDARSDGIETSMGRYVGTLNSGFHMVAPWTSVEEWTTRYQTISFEGDGNQAEHDNFYTEPRIVVRLGNQGEAYVTGTITWQITEQSVGDLWKGYKTFDDARRDYATPVVRSAVNTAFDGYNPLAGLRPVDPDSLPAQPSPTQPASTSTDAVPTGYVPVAVWSKKITEILRPLYEARHIELISVQITNVDYDPVTKKKLSDFSGEQTNTAIAGQKVLTAKKDAEASAARAKQAGQGCEALVRDLAAQDQLKNLPAGVQICSGASGGAGVLVNGSR